MAGMGLEGAYGAAGTMAGVRDWIEGRRRKVVQGQRDDDRVRNQRLQDEALATEAADRETALARQKILDERSATTFGNQQTVFGQGQADRDLDMAADATEQARRQELAAQIDAIPDMPQMYREIVKHEVLSKGSISGEMLKRIAPQPAEADMVVAPNGQLINRNDPANIGKNFAAPKEPSAGAQHPLAVAPSGQVWDPYDRSALGQNLGKPAAPPTLPAAQRVALQNADQAEKLLIQMKPLYTGDLENPDTTKRFKGVKDALGPFSGRKKDWMQWAGLDKDPTFARFSAASARLKNMVIQALTGAAVGVKEEERILMEIPTLTDVGGPRWEEKWNQSIQNIEYLRGAIHKQAGIGTQTPDANLGTTQDAPVYLTPPGGSAGGGKPRFTIVESK